MAKSARASSRKNNNQKLKKNVFGPVESARTERLSAKLMELVAQQIPEKETKADPNAMEDGKSFREVDGRLIRRSEETTNTLAANEEPTPSDQLKEEACKFTQIGTKARRHMNPSTNRIAAAMEVDAGTTLKKTVGGKKRIEKRRPKKGSIVFPKYKDRTSKRRK